MQHVLTVYPCVAGSGTLPNELKRGDVEVLSHSTCRAYWGSTVNSFYHICVKDLGDRRFGACNVSIALSVSVCLSLSLP